MKFVVTRAGLDSAQRAQANGYYISLHTFAVGSSYNYTPEDTATALKGTELHRARISGYRVIDENTVEYTCILDQNVGDFSYGEVGIYMEDGTLFAIASQDRMIEKLRGDSSATGNRIIIEARLSFSQAENILKYEILKLTNTEMLEIPSVAHLRQPVLAESNVYLTLSRDSTGQTIMAHKGDGDFEWTFPTFTRMGKFAVTEVVKPYTSEPAVTISGGGGEGATARANVENGKITAIEVTSPGLGYTSEPSVKITGGGGEGAVARATITSGVSKISVSNAGNGYTSKPNVIISGGGGVGAEAEAVIENGELKSIVVKKGGAGYSTVPFVTISGGGGSAATAEATVGTTVSSISLVTNSTTSLTANIGESAYDVTPGKYLVQFMSGDLKGSVRLVTSSTKYSVSWDSLEKLGAPVKEGDEFVLYQCSATMLDSHLRDPDPHKMYAPYTYVNAERDKLRKDVDHLEDRALTLNGTIRGVEVNSTLLKSGVYRVLNAGEAVPIGNDSGLLTVFANKYTMLTGKELTTGNALVTRQHYFSDKGFLFTRQLRNGAWTRWVNSSDPLPVGSVMQMPAGVSPPDGYLLANGSAFDGDVYPELATVYPSLTLPYLTNDDVGLTAYFPFDHVPNGWLECNGQIVDAAKFPTLARLLGRKYGEYGQLPQASLRYVRASNADIPTGTLLDSHIPKHSHPFGYAFLSEDDALFTLRNNRAAASNTGFRVSGNRGNDARANFGPGQELNLGTDPAAYIEDADPEVRPPTIALKMCVKATAINTYIKAHGMLQNSAYY